MIEIQHQSQLFERMSCNKFSLFLKKIIRIQKYKRPIIYHAQLKRFTKQQICTTSNIAIITTLQQRRIRAKSAAPPEQECNSGEKEGDLFIGKRNLTSLRTHTKPINKPCQRYLEDKFIISNCIIYRGYNGRQIRGNQINI